MKNKSQKGFTLIELLVVIAIIGILSSVVLASLNSAREKGQIAAIKSNLKNMIAQAELLYDVPGNYSTVCADSKITSMLTAITNSGATTSCYSNNNAGYSDVNLRWGVSALMNTSTPIKAYSVNSTGVTTWDTQGVNTDGFFVVNDDVSMDWSTANTACTTAGGRLPTLEELKTLSEATWIASGNTTYTPSSFINGNYWSSTIIPNNPNGSYRVSMNNGSVIAAPGIFSNYVRCVR